MKKVLLFVSILIVAACGGGGGGDTPPPSGYTLDGIVVNDVLNGQVCFDRNENRVCDGTEPNAPIQADGSFTLEGEDSDEFVPVIAEITPIQPFTLSLQALPTVTVLETIAGESVISALTTMVKAKMDGNPLLNQTQAENEVKTDLGISGTTNLFDPTDAQTASAEAAQVYAVITIMVEALTQLGIEFSPEFMTLIYNEVNAQLDIVTTTPPEDVVDNSDLDDKTKEEIEDEIGAIADPSAAIMQILEEGFYNLGYDWNGGNIVRSFEMNPNKLDGNSMYFDSSRTVYLDYIENGAHIEDRPTNLDLILGNPTTVEISTNGGLSIVWTQGGRNELANFQPFSIVGLTFTIHSLTGEDGDIRDFPKLNRSVTFSGDAKAITADLTMNGATEEGLYVFNKAAMEQILDAYFQ